MSDVVTSRPEGDATFSLYLVAWLFLALLSLGYLSVAFFRPDLIAHAKLPGVSTAAINKVSTSETRAPGELERGLAEIRAQLTDIQLKVMRGELREQELAARLSVVEARIEGLSAAAAPLAPSTASTVKPAIIAPVAEAPAEKARVAAAPVAAPSAKAAAAAKAADADADEAAAVGTAPQTKRAAPVETASVKAPARPLPAFGQPEVTVTREAAPARATAEPARSEDLMALQLGGAPSLDSLRLNWSILSDRHADILTGMQARFVTSDALGSTSYNLVAGPVVNRAEAIRICAKLRTEGVTCRLTSFRGSAL